MTSPESPHGYDPDEPKIVLDDKLDSDLFPQAVNQWTVVGTMIMLADSQEDHEDREEIVQVLKNKKPMPYGDYLESVAGQSGSEMGINKSDKIAVNRHDQLVREYNELITDLTSQNLENKKPRIEQMLDEAYGLFGRERPLK